MPRWQIWLQAFLAALTAFLQIGKPIHEAASLSRVTADEAMAHMHPDVFAGADAVTIPGPAAVVYDPADPIPLIEDDNEQARRQPPGGLNADHSQVEDEVNQATR